MHTNILTSHLPFAQKSRMARIEAIGWLCFALALITGSTATPFSKQMSGVFSPFSMVFVSEFATLIFIVLSFGVVPLMSKVFSINRHSVLPLLGFSLMNSVLGPLLIFTGMRTTSAVNAELFMKSETVFLLLFAGTFLNERIRQEHVLAATVVIAGIIVIALHGFTEQVGITRGDLFILASGAVYALGVMFAKKSVKDVHPEVALFFRGMVALSFFFLSSPFLHHTFVEELAAFPADLLAPAVGYAFVSCFLYLFCFYEAVERLDTRIISIGIPMISIGSILLSHFYLGEPLFWYDLVGASMIVGGAIIMEKADTSKEKNQVPHYSRQRQI